MNRLKAYALGMAIYIVLLSTILFAAWCVMGHWGKGALLLFIVLFGGCSCGEFIHRDMERNK